MTVTIEAAVLVAVLAQIGTGIWQFATMKAELKALRESVATKVEHAELAGELARTADSVHRVTGRVRDIEDGCRGNHGPRGTGRFAAAPEAA